MRKFSIANRSYHHHHHQPTNQRLHFHSLFSAITQLLSSFLRLLLPFNLVPSRSCHAQLHARYHPSRCPCLPHFCDNLPPNYPIDFDLQTRYLDLTRPPVTVFNGGRRLHTRALPPSPGAHDLTYASPHQPQATHPFWCVTSFPNTQPDFRSFLGLFQVIPVLQSLPCHQVEMLCSSHLSDFDDFGAAC